MSRLINELLRFGGVGLLATAIHALVYMAALSVAQPQLANLLGYGVAVCVSYFGHGYFSFAEGRHTRRHGDQLWRFFVTSLAGFGLNAGFVAVCTHLFHRPGLAVWFIVGVTPLLTFLALKFWVYRRRGD